jgi:hypothetical protein
LFSLKRVIAAACLAAGVVTSAGACGSSSDTPVRPRPTTSSRPTAPATAPSLSAHAKRVLRPFIGRWEFVCADADTQLTVKPDFTGEWVSVDLHRPVGANRTTATFQLEAVNGRAKLIITAIDGPNPDGLHTHDRFAVKQAPKDGGKELTITTRKDDIGLYSPRTKYCG